MFQIEAFQKEHCLDAEIGRLPIEASLFVSVYRALQDQSLPEFIDSAPEGFAEEYMRLFWLIAFEFPTLHYLKLVPEETDDWEHQVAVLRTQPRFEEEKRRLEVPG